MTPAAQRQAAFRQRRDARLAGYKEALEAIANGKEPGRYVSLVEARAIAVEALKL